MLWHRGLFHKIRQKFSLSFCLLMAINLPIWWYIPLRLNFIGFVFWIGSCKFSCIAHETLNSNLQYLSSPIFSLCTFISWLVLKFYIGNMNISCASNKLTWFWQFCFTLMLLQTTSFLFHDEKAWAKTLGTCIFSQC